MQSFDRTKLIDVAMGRQAPDLYIRNARLVNVLSGEIIPETAVAVVDGRIAWVGPDLLQPADYTVVIDAQNRFLAPGLIDGHMHLESSMLTFREFAKAALRWGTTAVFPDPHEIANVCGTAGVFALIEESKQVPLRSFMLMPSCVPALQGQETSGAVIDAQTYQQAITHPDIWGMGEMMNYPGVVFNQPDVQQKIQATRQAGKPLTGHLTSDDPHLINAYAASGVDSCHESVTAGQILAKLRAGVYAMIREGSAWKDLKTCIQPFVRSNLDTSGVMLVTDDVHADTLIQTGHINAVINMAIAEGISPVKAIQMATINTARYFRLDDTIGCIAPGRLADLILFDDLEQIVPSSVYVGGKLAYTAEKPVANDQPVFDWPPELLNSIKLPHALSRELFQLPVRVEQGSIELPVIEVHENSAITDHLTCTLKVADGIVQADLEQDLIMATCLERYTGAGGHATALVKGFQLQRGAMAQTIAHDCHNILVIGTNPDDMLLAVQKLAEQGGGIVVAANGQVKASLQLEIGGLMTTAPIETVASQLQAVESACRELGCPMQSPFMTLALVALPVIPHLRLTDQGLFDVDRFERVVPHPDLRK